MQPNALFTAGPEPIPPARPAAANLRLSIAMLCTVIAVTGILATNPSSLVGLAWYFFVWCGFILLCHREDLSNFSLAFTINAAFTSLFVVVQSAAYPDSYGTTSPLSSSWTDDSYFFTLAADVFPADLFSRPDYWEYSSLFPTLIRFLTPFRIEHPLDALFFQSGTAALLATFTSRFMFQLSRDHRLARVVYVLCVICPFLMMNGGVVLLRDTLSAALFIYAVCCLGERRFLLAAVAIALQIGIRPGTGMLMLPAYAIVYFHEVRVFCARYPFAATVTAAALVAGAVLSFPYLLEYLGTYYDLSTVSILGRELFADLNADPGLNVIFLRVQEFPFPVRLVLNAGYIFLYPFLSLRFLTETTAVDLRGFALGLMVPIYGIWLNGWWVAGALSPKPLIARHRAIVVATAVTLALVGIYSLQTRHKTIIYPLYYLIVATGLMKANPFARRCGYVVSSALFCLQVASL